MRVPARSLASMAILLASGWIAPYAAPVAPAENDLQKKSPSECLFRDVRYGVGTVICVAPAYGQQCDENGRWKDPTNQAPIDKVCESAKIIVPGDAAQCTYHDAKYSPGALICVGPRYGQICEKGGGWSATREEACLHAQIPAPAYPVTPSTSK
jgi:hypothetical protein